jgi:putative FmdB family regulatory protein
MSVTIDLYEVICTACGEVFGVRQPLTDDSAPSLSCPRCGHDAATDPEFRRDGGWIALVDEDRDPL